MNKYVVQTFSIYVIALMVCCFINIDKIAPWYRLEVATEENSPVLRGLEAMEQLAKKSGVRSTVKKFDCSTAFLFNQTYKDNSDCFLEDQEVGETRTLDFKNKENLRMVARILYERLRQARTAIAPDFIRADCSYPTGTPPLNAIRTVQFVPKNGKTAQPEGNLPQEHATQANIEVKMGANKQLLRQQNNPETPVPALDSLVPTLQERDLSPTSILVIGDSLAIGLARSFERALQQYDDVTFARVGKVSSGLAIPHLFDWEKKVQVLIDKYKPNLIVILMGINDANNNIRVDGEKAILGTASWPLAYEKRVERFLDIIKTKNVPVYWVGLPIVRDEAMTKRIWLTNETAKKACTNASDCRFIDTWELLTDEKGQYTNYKKDNKGYNVRIRAKDGIHFSREGGDLLTNFILDYIVRYVDLHPKKISSNLKESICDM